jgi:6-pyruvoyltetrahydropterin/6-carboxytetrahydropterin synthase
MLTCTRIIEFCAGHRVLGHENKCAHLHGHQYKVEITAEGGQDAIGRVVDFSVIKEAIGGWIDQHWDHGFLLNASDPAVGYFSTFVPRNGQVQKHYLFMGNPTAENIAKLLLTGIAPTQLKAHGADHITVVKVKVWETPNCFAIAKL